jgi:hypothetical protein
MRKYFLKALIPISIFLVTFVGLLWFRERIISKPPVQRIFNVAARIENLDLVYPEKGNGKNFPYLLPAHNFEHTYLREDGSLIYRVNYTLDGAGYRNPLIKTGSYQKHLLLVGCSWTFGLGLPPEETLSHKVQKLTPNHRSYNLAINGSGPHDHLYLMDKYPLSQYVTEPSGLMVYVFFSDQFNRANSAPAYLEWAEKGRPFYKMVNGALTYMGQIGDSKDYLEYQQFKAKGLARSYIETYEMTSSLDAKMDLFVEIILSIKKNYLKQFPQGQFVFGVVPYADPLNAKTTKLLEALTMKKIKVIPIESMGEHFKEILKEGEMSKYLIKDDGHPNGLANSKFSQHLIDWLKLKGDL